MNLSPPYDYIIAGGGASGLSLAWHFTHSPLSDRRILIVDSDLNPTNDKTWCFWHASEPPFAQLLRKSWRQVSIYIEDTHKKETLHDYSYHCIRSGDFRQYILDEISAHSNIDILEAEIRQIDGNDTYATLKTDQDTYQGTYIFQSCFVPPEFDQSAPKYPLIQHFLGYEIETKKEVFDPQNIILMDFDETFNEGIAFMYVLPWSEGNALAEYTIFSNQIKNPSFYKEKIELYLNNKFALKRSDYRIQRTEYGEIPMQDLPYTPWYAPNVMNIGIVGGVTKPSTGYTFSRIQNHSKNIIDQLSESGTLERPLCPQLRYRAYDLWLLQILHDHPEKGLNVLRELFINNSFDAIFKFLGEQTSWKEDLKIMSSVPYLPFFKAMWKTKGRLIQI